MEYRIRKVLGKSLRKFDLIQFERKISRTTGKVFNETYFRAIEESEENQLPGLNSRVITDFHNKHVDSDSVFYLHLPDYVKALGNYSAFYNLGIALKHLGYSCIYFSDIEELAGKELEPARNNIVMVLDEVRYLGCRAWDIKDRLGRDIKLGTFLEFANLEKRESIYLDSYNNKKLDFFFTFSTDEYNAFRFPRFFEENAEPAAIEFGANPFIHYPVHNEKELDYIFLGSTNRSKLDRYIEYFSPIFEKYRGFLYGPGWMKYYRKNKPFTVDRTLYSYGKVGLNLSVKVQLDYPRELNERTYQLAACGIPQLIDEPLLLNKRFPEGAVFSAAGSTEYLNLFRALVQKEIPESVVSEHVNLSYETVLKNHTIFHRADKLIVFLKEKNVIPQG